MYQVQMAWHLTSTSFVFCRGGWTGPVTFKSLHKSTRYSTEWASTTQPNQHWRVVQTAAEQFGLNGELLICPKCVKCFTAMCRLCQGQCVGCAKVNVSAVPRSMCRMCQGQCVGCAKVNVSAVPRSMCQLCQGQCVSCAKVNVSAVLKCAKSSFHKILFGLDTSQVRWPDLIV